MSEWVPVDYSMLSGPPAQRAGADVLGLSEVLPFHRLGWQAFEHLQRTMMHDILGLRDPRQYGDRGQKQMGIDLIGRAADGTETALPRATSRSDSDTTSRARSHIQSGTPSWPGGRPARSWNCVWVNPGHTAVTVTPRRAYRPFAQRLKDVLGLQIGDGTAHIMKNIIARERAGRHAVSG